MKMLPPDVERLMEALPQEVIDAKLGIKDDEPASEG